MSNEALLRALKVRFEKNMNRHQGLEWAKVQAKLDANTEKLWSLNEMERTSGEPDVNSAPSFYGVRAFRGSLRVQIRLLNNNHFSSQ